MAGYDNMSQEQLALANANAYGALSPLEFGNYLTTPGTLVGNDYTRIRAGQLGFSNPTDYANALRQASAYRNSNAGKTEVALDKFNAEKDRQQVEFQSFGKLLQGMGDRAALSSLDPNEFKRQVSLMNGEPQMRMGQDENGKPQAMAEAANPITQLSQRAQQIAGMLQSNDPSINKSNLRNELNRLGQLQDYMQKRQQPGKSITGINAQTVYEGISPKDIITGMQQNPKMAPLDAGLIAHKTIQGLPMNMFDQGKLPQSTEDMLLAKSQLREEIQRMGPNQITLERIKQLQDLEPVIKAVEEIKRQAKEKQQQQAWSLQMKLMDMQHAQQEKLEGRAYSQRMKMEDFKLGLVKDLLKEKIKAKLGTAPSMSSSVNANPTINITAPQSQ